MRINFGITLRRAVPLAAGAVLIGACGVVGTAMADGAGTAKAGTADVGLDFEATGSSWVKKADSEVPLGPGTLHIDLNVADGTLAGDLALPPSQSSFNAFGIVPTTAKVEFLPEEPLLGVLDNGEVTAVAKLNLKLSDVKAGPLPLPSGDTCTTSTPISVTMRSVPGFDPLQGGDLVGSYEIPPFADCQLAEPAVNALVPGPDSTITLTIKRTQ